MKRTAMVIITAGVLAAAPASMAPARASGISGFTSQATATPLKVELYEPAVPIPADPQVELNFSYTRVDATSGPVGSARASALWPGDSVGEGWKTIGDAVGLPAQLTKDGYPEQVNAQSEGPTTAAQEPFPGSVARVSATDQKAVAKAGYATGGDLPEASDPGESAGESAGSVDPVQALSSGDLSVLGKALTGSSAPAADAPPGASSGGSPLGALSVLVDAEAMSSVSSTDYSGDSVITHATSRLGQVSLVAGLVKLTGVQVLARTTSSLTAGAKSTYQVHVGGISIAGQSFTLTPEGIEGAGTTTPIPGLPGDPAAALAALGISVSMPKPQVTSDGSQGAVAAQGMVVTIDSGPLRAALPTLPLGDLINQLPDQAQQLKGLLFALTEAHPKVVVTLGTLTTEATTVAGVDLDLPGTQTPATTGASGTASGTGAAAGTAARASAAPETSAVPQSASAPTVATTPVRNLSAVPGLPPLGSIPTMLGLLGLLLASGAGWYLRRAGGLLFGVGGTCVHGLTAGIPDLRKA